MTQNAQEIFVMQLARAGAQQADKFLRVRGLQKSDRDDVIAGALLWCWENRAKYDPLVAQLDMWFIRAVRNSWESWRANELPPSTASLDGIGTEDTTFNTVAAESDARSLLKQLTAQERNIVEQALDGVTWREMIKSGIPRVAIDQTKAVLRTLRKEMPDNAARAVLARTAPSVSSDDADDKLSGIDMALEKLEFSPAAGKDCPPCWRCMWFEGYMPAGKRETRLKIEDAEVREAVKNTEARKIEIAQQVRDGIL